jgi:hypothetical protein
MSKQTAVGWLIEELGEYFPNEIGGIHYMVNKAKQMEREQIIEAHDEGQQKIVGEGMNYYNATYGSEKSDDNFKQFSLYEHKETIATADTPTSSQTEISDEEIKKEADYQFRHFEQSKKDIWTNACKWYREQLKQRQ